MPWSFLEPRCTPEKSIFSYSMRRLVHHRTGSRKGLLLHWRIDRCLTLFLELPSLPPVISRRNQPLSLSHRALAAMCAAMVLALTLFAASPAAHDWLHAAQKSHTCADHEKSAPASNATDHGCAVVLFANGVDTPVAAIALVPPRVVTQNVSPATAAEFYLVSPRYLRQPERGPPLSRVA